MMVLMMEVPDYVEQELLDITNAMSKTSGEYKNMPTTVEDTLRILIVEYYLLFDYPEEKWNPWLKENIDLDSLKKFILDR